MKRPLTFLDDLRIASPCPADWAAMAGDDRVRHCGRCDKAVYDLSAMTAAAATKLIEETEAKV